VKDIFPRGAMILGGLLLIAAGRLPATGPSGPVATFKDYTLFILYEKQTPTVDQVIAIRGAKDFVTSAGFAGYLLIDDDNTIFSGLVKKAKERGIESPFLAAGKPEAGKIKEFKKVVPWKTGFEDILK
jgi:hypothetical protein